MDFQIINTFMLQYGVIAIFIIVLLEYMNLPGFPAGIIMPVSGIWASQGNISFLTVMIVTVGAGLAGSMILYLLGYLGGDAFQRGYLKLFPKQKEGLKKNVDWLQEHGCYGVLIAKLIPMFRTLISIPAGMVRMKLVPYVVSSTIGVFLWNLVFVGAGYFAGDYCMSVIQKAI